MANLNTIFGGDASGIVAASKQAKSAVKDFTRTTDQAMSSLGDAFGVNTGKLEQLTSAAKGLGLKLSESSNQGVAAFGKLLGSINAVQMGIAGLGVGAAVVAFKALNAEASNFKATIAGANLEMQTAAYVQTYAQVLHDMNAETGREMQRLGNILKKTWAQIKGGAGQALMNSMTTTSGAFMGLLDPTLWTKLLTQSAVANSRAETAARLTGEINDLELQRLNRSTEWLKRDAEIARLQGIIRDTQASTTERAEALAQAQSLIKQKYAEQREIEGGIYQRMVEIDDLAENTLEETQATVNQKNKVVSLEIAENNELNALLKAQNSIAKSAQSEAAARQKAADAAMKTADAIIAANNAMLEGKRSGADWLSGATGVLAINGKATKTGASAGLVGVGNVGEVTLAMRGLKDYSQEATATVLEGVAAMSDAIGGLIGDLATGGEAWKNFGNVALGSFADMMQSVGKLVMKEGIAVTAVWKSLTDPTKAPLAIAAGSALVAIGASIKAGLSNVASGSYSAFSGVATGGYGSSSSASSGFSMREVNVKVTGTLQASGSQLVAVINNENKRTKATT